MFLTPDDLSDSAASVIALVIPYGNDARQLLLGALAELCFAENYEKHGLLEPEQSAQAWVNALHIGIVDMIGVINFFAVEVPLGWVIANGQLLDVVEYRDLFNKVGYAFGGSGGSFAVPDLIGRYALGAPESALGAIVGGNDITITEINLPFSSGVVQSGSVVPVPVAVPTAGPPQSIDNRPESIKLIPAIFAGR